MEYPWKDVKFPLLKWQIYFAVSDSLHSVVTIIYQSSNLVTIKFQETMRGVTVVTVVPVVSTCGHFVPPPGPAFQHFKNIKRPRWRQIPE